MPWVDQSQSRWHLRGGGGLKHKKKKKKWGRGGIQRTRRQISLSCIQNEKKNKERGFKSYFSHYGLRGCKREVLSFIMLIKGDKKKQPRILEVITVVKKIFTKEVRKKILWGYDAVWRRHRALWGDTKGGEDEKEESLGY